MFRTTVVLVFIVQENQAQREKMNGIYSAAIRRGWQIQPVGDVFSRSRLADLKSQWGPMGCLIDATAMPQNNSAPQRLRRTDLLGLPTVLMGRDLTRRQQIFDCSAQNPRLPAVTAARKFRALGLSQFAFVGDPRQPPWSIERGNLFANAVRSWEFQSYQGDDPFTPDGFAEFCQWLKTLPKPTGIFLAADHLAMTFYRACQKARRAIGKDLFVISVDNEERVCTSLAPTLSSIHLDYFQAGNNAIALLERRINDMAAPPRLQAYGMIELVNRASTARPFTDPRVGKAVNYIEEHFRERIDATSVANAMGCCRRLAEKLFKAHVGSTILDTIRDARLAKAKALLEATNVPIDAIPPMCGYRSLPHMKTFFRRKTGMTMRDWRKAHASTSSL